MDAGPQYIYWYNVEWEKRCFEAKKYSNLFARFLPFEIARATKLAVKRSMDAGPQYTYWYNVD